MLWTITEWISRKRAGQHNPNFLPKGQIRGIDTKITFEVEKKKVHTFEEVRFSISLKLLSLRGGFLQLLKF
jgi:hypothetical protein